MNSPSLQSLLSRPDLWRGRDTRSARLTVWQTGFAALDASLHQGGWPAHGLSELLCEPLCPLRLLLPALAQAARQGLIVLANPPALPGAQAWAAAGIDLARLLLLSAPANEPALLRRACLEAASSDAVAALLLWLPAREQDPRLLRRLHLAAQQGRCWLVAIRPHRFRQHSSPAPLRLQLQPAGADMTVEIIKQPGGWAGQRLTLPWLPASLHDTRPATAQLAAPSHMATEAPQQQPVTPQPAPPPELPEHRLGLPGKMPMPPLALPEKMPEHMPKQMPGSAPTENPSTPQPSATPRPARRKSRKRNSQAAARAGS